MKRVYIILAMLVSSLFADGFFAIEHDYNAAIKEAKKIHKPIFLMFSTKTCPECNYMKQVVFKDKRVSDYIHKNFLPVMLDIKTDKIPKDLKFIGIPTFFVISENGKNLGKLVGAMPADKFLNAFKGNSDAK